MIYKLHFYMQGHILIVNNIFDPRTTIDSFYEWISYMFAESFPLTMVLTAGLGVVFILITLIMVIIMCQKKDKKPLRGRPSFCSNFNFLE